MGGSEGDIELGQVTCNELRSGWLGSHMQQCPHAGGRWKPDCWVERQRRRGGFPVSLTRQVIVTIVLYGLRPICTPPISRCDMAPSPACPPRHWGLHHPRPLAAGTSGGGAPLGPGIRRLGRLSGIRAVAGNLREVCPLLA